MPAATSFICRSKTSNSCRATAREDTEAQLDRLGGVGWQTRKARMKNRIREMAKGLIEIAAQRQLRQAPKLAPPEGLVRRILRALPL